MAKQRENQPRDGTVPLTVYKLLTKQLGWIATNGQVYI